MKETFHHSLNSRRLRVCQQGFSLIEIMVALTLSLVLVAGVIQMYLSSKESYRLQEQMAFMQENQRLALQFLQRDIQMAGYFDVAQATNQNAGFIPKFNVDAELGGLLNTRDGDNNLGDISDVITVRYLANTDCLGQALTAANSDVIDGNTWAVNKYYVTTDADGKYQLMCLGNGNPATPQPLVSGIRSMQILYGEDTDPPGAEIPAVANKYVKASEANLNRVVSVRISLLFMSDRPIKAEALTQTFQLLDAPVITIPATDIESKHRYQIVTTTIQLRNNNT